jgi:hypothetical protein
MAVASLKGAGPATSRQMTEQEDMNMSALVGFEIGFWDYLTFLTAILSAGIFLTLFCWLAGLPGRIAIARDHPEAEAVSLMGWAGILPTIYPWVQAFIWAFKPTQIVDIRRYPGEERRWIEQEIARLKGQTPPPATEPPAQAKPPTGPRPPDKGGNQS